MICLTKFARIATRWFFAYRVGLWSRPTSFPTKLTVRKRDGRLGLPAELPVELFKKVDDLQPVGAGRDRPRRAVGELDQRRACGGELVCGGVQLMPGCVGDRDQVVAQPRGERP